MKCRAIFALGLLTVLWAHFAAADSLVLKTGDSLLGRLQQLEYDTLVFRTNLAGQVMVPVDEVRSLTSGNVQVLLKNGERADGALILRDNRIELRQQDGRRRTWAPEEVASVTPAAAGPGEDAVAPAAGEPESGPVPKLKGSLETGYYQRWGTRDKGGLFGRLALGGGGEGGEGRLELFLDAMAEPEFPRWFTADAEWAFGRGRTLRPYVAAGLERDFDKALSFQARISAGVTQTFLQAETHGLDGSLGLEAETSDYDARWLDEDNLFGHFSLLRRDRDRSEQRLNLRLGLRYSRAIFGNGEFTESLYAFPGLSDPGYLRARSESAVLFPVGSRLKLKLNLLLDYENEPDFYSVDEWRTSVGASVLWDF